MNRFFGGETVITNTWCVHSSTSVHLRPDTGSFVDVSLSDKDLLVVYCDTGGGVIIFVIFEDGLFTKDGNWT